MSTYTIGQSLGLDDGKGSSGIDDTTFYIIIGILCCFLVLSSILVMIMMSGSSGGGGDVNIGGGTDNADIISAIAAANQTKLPVTINLTTSPQYYPKLN